MNKKTIHPNMIRIKDFFIPHEGNQYKPRSLHSKRIFFYIISALIIKAVLVSVIIFLPIEAWLSPDILMEQSSKIISLTNDIREASGIKPLQENLRLNQAAFRKAQDMMVNQYFAHTSPSGLGLSYWLNNAKYEYVVAGENLAVGFNNAEEVVEAWKNSPTHYSNMIDEDFENIGVALVAGNYEGAETIMAAQYFGTPASTTAVSIEKNAEAREDLSLADAKVYIGSLSGTEENIVAVSAVLPAGTEEAVVEMDKNKIALSPTEGRENGWSGTAIIKGGKDLSAPVLMPVLTAKDSNGKISAGDLPVSGMTLSKSSLWDQYSFIKGHQSGEIKSLFDITSIYYKILLAIIILSLLLNIFIEIRKQHPHIILSASGLILILIVLIIV